MTVVYRLLRRPFAATAFDGEGSYRYGGRWSHPGTRMLYTAEHLSLAMIEYLVHVDPNRPPTDLLLARAEVPDDLERVEYRASELGSGWRSYPPPAALADLGSRFVAEGKAALMVVPSALAPVEKNWLFNPEHADFQRIQLLPLEPFAYDSRLL